MHNIMKPARVKGDYLDRLGPYWCRVDTVTARCALFFACVRDLQRFASVRSCALEELIRRRKIGQLYDIFLERVSEGRTKALGRTMSKDMVDAVGQGRVWTGQQAVQNGLVDRLGGLRQALDAARSAGGLPEDCPVSEAPVVEKTLLETAIELAGFKGSSLLTLDGLPVQVRDVARAIAPLAVYQGDVALARTEWVPLEDTVGKDDE